MNAVRNIVEFKKNPDVLQIGRFSDPPQLEDLRALTVGKDDFDAASCRVNDCGVRLPADVIRRLPAEVDLEAPDAAATRRPLVQGDVVHARQRILVGNSGRFLSYDDDPKQVRPVEEFDGLMQNTPAIGALSSSLRDHLAAFPARRMAGAEDFLYWSKEKFGIAPFITVTHVVDCVSVGAPVPRGVEGRLLEPVHRRVAGADHHESRRSGQSSVLSRLHEPVAIQFAQGTDERPAKIHCRAPRPRRTRRDADRR